MKTRCHFTGMTVVPVVTVLSTLFLIACQTSQQQATSAPAAVSPVPSTEKVFILFEGPWAFAPDPKDAGSVVAIAPKTKGHHDLYLKASNQAVLASGTYDLSFPAHSGTAAGTADPSIAQAKIDPQSLQRALDSKSGRYVVRLPKPEAYVVSARSRSRLGAIYPPGADTENEYATAVSLRYNVSSLNGFSLGGTVDDGTFNPLLLRVETPVIRFVIRPAQEDDPKDKCDTHSREGFRDLTKLLGLTLYVDFPEYTDDCHSKDPQHPRPRAAAGSSIFSDPAQVVARFFTRNLTGNLADVQGASAAGGARSLGDYLAAVMYFFNAPGVDCDDPHIILTIG